MLKLSQEAQTAFSKKKEATFSSLGRELTAGRWEERVSQGLGGSLQVGHVSPEASGLLEGS